MKTDPLIKIRKPGLFWTYVIVPRFKNICKTIQESSKREKGVILSLFINIFYLPVRKEARKKREICLYDLVRVDKEELKVNDFSSATVRIQSKLAYFNICSFFSLLYTWVGVFSFRDKKAIWRQNSFIVLWSAFCRKLDFLSSQ